MSEKVVVCCAPFGSDWRWIIEELAAPDVRWKYFSETPRYSLQRYFQQLNLDTPLAGFRSVLFAVRHKARLLITFGPRLSFWCALICRILGIKLNHLAFSFNFAELPTGFKKRLFRFGFKQLTNLRVHSHMEQTLYSEYFGIPVDRIEVRLWSMNVPVASPEPPVLTEPYVSAVGGNARDYQTLLEASRLLPDTPMVWVVRPENVAGFDLPPSVRVLCNIPHPKAMNVVKNSRLTVVPLKGSQVPCGHVTLVSAMLLEKAIVATDSAGICDYVTDGWNGLLCRPQDAQDLAAKIRSLWNDPDEARRLGVNGYKFAEENCSERSVREDMFEFLKSHGLAAEILAGK
jgi:hypothetical protein